jgi:hypothetical protein
MLGLPRPSVLKEFGNQVINVRRAATIRSGKATRRDCNCANATPCSIDDATY